MSTRVATFATSSRIDDHELLRVLAHETPALLKLAKASRLAVQIGPVFPEQPLRWFNLLGNGEASRGRVAETLARQLPVIVSVVWDDRVGGFVYDRIAPSGRLTMNTWEGETGISEGTLPTTLPPYDDAIDLGLGLDFPDEPPHAPVTHVVGGGWFLAEDRRAKDPPVAATRAALDKLRSIVSGHVDDDDAGEGKVVPKRDGRQRDDRFDDAAWLGVTSKALERGDVDGAREAFRKAVTINPGEIGQLMDWDELAFLREEPFFRELYASQYGDDGADSDGDEEDDDEDDDD
jgi:hypothetical protein